MAPCIVISLDSPQHAQPILHCQHEADDEDVRQVIGQIGGGHNVPQYKPQFMIILKLKNNDNDNQVRATVPIKAGSPLYISRADPLLDMHTR